MDEFAFTPALLQLLRTATPTLPIVHVPSQLCATWKLYPHLGAAAPTTSSPSSAAAAATVAAPSPMRVWFQTHRAQLLAARYLAFHWSCGHFCSILVDLDMWRAGPHGTSVSTAAPAAAAADATPPAPTIAPSVGMQSDPSSTTAALSSPSSTPTRSRKSSRARREAQQDSRSTSRVAVPMFHLDSLPDSCGFLSDRTTLLRSLCVELNELCGTEWPVRLSRDLHAHLHLCGPTAQTDTWSCGYRLLHAWAGMLAAVGHSSTILTPESVNVICDPAEEQAALQQMVDRALALYDAAGDTDWVSRVGTKHSSMSAGFVLCLLMSCSSVHVCVSDHDQHPAHRTPRRERNVQPLMLTAAARTP